MIVAALTPASASGLTIVDSDGDSFPRLRWGDPSHSMQATRVVPDRPVPSLMHRRRVVGDRITYVGLDVHKDGIANWRRPGTTVSS